MERSFVIKMVGFMVQPGPKQAGKNLVFKSQWASLPVNQVHQILKAARQPNPPHCSNEVAKWWNFPDSEGCQANKVLVQNPVEMVLTNSWGRS